MQQDNLVSSLMFIVLYQEPAISINILRSLGENFLRPQSGNSDAYVTKLVIAFNSLCKSPCWLSGKESTCNAGDVGLIPESGRCPGGGNGNPLQYSCLGNSVDREAWGLQSKEL